jgi:hypothetical protein
MKFGSLGEYDISAKNNIIPVKKIKIPNISASLFMAKFNNKFAVFLISI